MLQFNIDESEDETAFAVAGYGSSPEKWASFSSRWQHGLDGMLHGDPFKMSRANEEWSEALQKERIGYFYDIIHEYVSHSISIVVDPRELKEVMTGFEDDRFADPYFFCFHFFIIDATYRAVSENQHAEFVFDDGRRTKIIDREWSKFLDGAPQDIKSAIVGRPRFLDDRSHLPLQAADLKAWWVRRRFKEQIQGHAHKIEMRNSRPHLPKILTRSHYYSKQDLVFLRMSMESGAFPIFEPGKIGFSFGGNFVGVDSRPRG